MQNRSGGGMGMGSGRGNMPSFADFDTNGDGKISEQEFTDGRARRMAERAKEGRPMRNLNAATSFADIDTDHDGSISPEEFAAHQRGGRKAATAP